MDTESNSETNKKNFKDILNIKLDTKSVDIGVPIEKIYPKIEPKTLVYYDFETTVKENDIIAPYIVHLEVSKLKKAENKAKKEYMNLLFGIFIKILVVIGVIGLFIALFFLIKKFLKS